MNDTIRGSCFVHSGTDKKNKKREGEYPWRTNTNQPLEQKGKKGREGKSWEGKGRSDKDVLLGCTIACANVSELDM